MAPFTNPECLTSSRQVAVFTSAADGTVTHLTKLLVLDFFSSNIFLHTVTDLSSLAVKRFAPEISAVLASSPMESGSVEDYTEMLWRRQKLLQQMQSLTDTISFLTRALLGPTSNDRPGLDQLS
jgi:hypothetical protein